MSTTPQPTTSDAPEVRDADEISEHAQMGAAHSMPSSWPRDAAGNYLAIVTGACSDKIPTVQFGNVVIGPVMIQRPVAAGSLQEVIDAARETQRAAEYVVGVERRLLQWALDPAAKVASPVPPDEAFAAPPAGYDSSKAVHPAEAAAGASAVAANHPPVEPASMVQSHDQPTAAEQAELDGSPPAAPQVG